MVDFETVDELVEKIADAVGVYGCGEHDDHPYNCNCRICTDDHPYDCNCRICFVSDITERIRQSVQNERFLATMKETPN